MPRRGWVSLLFAVLMLGGWTGLAAAATPPPSPPPFCFVMKDGALPTCDQASDGTWTAIYPDGTRTTGGSSTSGSSGTKRDIEIAIVVAAVIGIGAIAVWQWGPKRR